MPNPTLYEAYGRRQSLSAWARESGHTYSMLASRLACGSTLGQALVKPRRLSGYEIHTLNGEHGTLAQWADRYNIKYYLLKQRIKTMGLEEALTMPLIDKRRK